MSENIQRFEDLIAWQKYRELTKLIYHHRRATRLTSKNSPFSILNSFSSSILSPNH